ncbi:hypothetical protein PM082_020655 [Marasmius tenuissimus]|nr:hypothetical protein PM082_020655 [Marasmius tenuissimus]
MSRYSSTVMGICDDMIVASGSLPVHHLRDCVGVDVGVARDRCARMWGNPRQQPSCRTFRIKPSTGVVFVSWSNVESCHDKSKGVGEASIRSIKVVGAQRETLQNREKPGQSRSCLLYLCTTSGDERSDSPSHQEKERKRGGGNDGILMSLVRKFGPIWTHK